jgi:hypothetical protein
MMQGAIEVEGLGLIPESGACNTSVAWDVKFTFADGVRMVYRGTRNGAEASDLNNFDEWKARYGKLRDHGTAFEGTDGWVHIDRAGINVSKETLLDTPESAFATKLIKSGNHVRNFLDSIKSRQPAICPIEDSVQADVLCHLSDIATRVNRRLTWDPAREQFVGDQDANARLKLRPARQGWTWA